MANFDTPIEREGDTLTGPWRMPRQMLMAQAYDGHASIHDDSTAQGLGFKGGTIEGPTHFSQFDPLCHAIWGDEWFAHGCISAHYRSPVFEGEEVRASLERQSADRAAITMAKRDGTEVLKGTVSIGPDHRPSALDERLAGLAPLEQPVLMSDAAVGAKTGRIPVRMDLDQHMGDLYPFSLAGKLERMTEPSEIYRKIIPFEMVSVLVNSIAREQPFPVRGPSVGLFADQEIRMLRGPLKVGEPYEVEREIVALSGSRKTESMWVLSRVFVTGDNSPVATMLLNTATLKASYAQYEADRSALYGDAADG